MKISETTTTKVQILESDRSKLPEAVLCRVVYPICNIGQLNANNRVYEREVWERVLSDEAICEKMAGRTLFGQAEHPAETQSDLQLTSHTIFEMWIAEDGRVYQKMDVLDTPTGRIVDTLLRAGCQVGVSTRAEGDLEDMQMEEGKTCQRVIPESYRYVTTDFTADPSTFNVAPVALQRNVIPTLQREMKNKEGGSLAKALLESIQKADEAHTSVTVVSDDGTQVSVEADGQTTTQVSSDGTVSVSPEVPIESMPMEEPLPEPGNTGLGMPAIEPDGEMGETPMEEPEEEMPESRVEESEINELIAKDWPKDLSRFSVDKLKAAQAEIRDDRESGNLPFSGAEAKRRLSAIAAELKKKTAKKESIETTLTEEAWLKLTPAELKQFSTVLEGEAFQKCVSGGGRVRRVSGDKEHGLEPDEYVNYCFKGGKSYRGEVHKKENEAEVNESPLSIEDVKALFVSIDSAFARHLTGVAPDRKTAAQRGVDVGLELTSVGQAALQESKIKEGRQVVRMEGDSVGEVVFDTNDDGTFTITVKGETIATGIWSGGGTMDARVSDVNQLVDVLGDVMFTHGEVNVEESQTYRDLVDLKVTEASVRAERDALLEEVQKSGDTGVQVRILVDKLTQLQESSAAEIAGLRRVLETKAREAGISKQKLDEALSTRKSEAELNAMFAKHQEELVEAATDAKAAARVELLTEYFDRRLATCSLQVDENSRALLEGCRSLGDVDSLVDKLIGVARRSALHSKPLSEVKVRKTEPRDPEQQRADESVGNLMKHLNG